MKGKTVEDEASNSTQVHALYWHHCDKEVFVIEDHSHQSKEEKAETDQQSRRKALVR